VARKTKFPSDLIDPNQRWLDVFESARYLHVSPQQVRRYLHDGDLRASRVGKGFLLDRADLDQFVLRRKKPVAPYRRGTRPYVAERWAKLRKEAA
jgi:excisionase family DNA binding protein